jgi:hypothetical protein
MPPVKKFFILLFLLAAGKVEAQKSAVKFGNIPMEALEMTSYDKDSSASAVVLMDYGEAYLNSMTTSLSLAFDRHVRIKILKKDGLRWADAVIELYRSGSNEERVSNLKASTYNLENSKIVETKMSKEAVFKTKVNQNINQQKFTLPNVKEGSVIEYSYKVNSDFIFNFPNWEFQKEIPVIRSEYWAWIPEFCIFEKYMQGFLGLTDYHVVKGDPNGYRFLMKDVPAFIPEPHMACEEDYLSKVNFALSTINIPGVLYKDIMGSWEKLSTELLEDEDFGKVVARSGFLKTKVDELTNGVTDTLKRAELIYTFVKNNIEWNGVNDIYAENPKTAFESKKGSAADINLILASMLEKAGFPVKLIILSTRDHGKIRTQYPMSKQFNYVICAVKVNHNTIFLDATEKYMPMGILPERCLNGTGMLLFEGHYSWVDIKPKAKGKTSISTALTLDDSGILKGKLTIMKDGYDAFIFRQQYHAKSESEFIKDSFSSASLETSNVEFSNINDEGKPVKQILDVSVEDQASASGDIIYVNPFIYGQLKENPFKSDARQYPVDFGFPSEKLLLSQINIPNGYTVDELPKSVIFVLPDNAGKYVYSASRSENIISITSNLQINKCFYLPDEYLNLREFYNHVIGKQAEQIVLKKK